MHNGQHNCVLKRNIRGHYFGFAVSTVTNDYNFLCCRKGDYNRYLAEFATGEERKEVAEKSLVAYKGAMDTANADLTPTHPIRLGRRPFILVCNLQRY